MLPRPRHFLITGGAGFVGSHLTRLLLAEGHRVTALDDLSTGRRALVAPFDPHPRFRLVVGSVTDAAVVERTVAPAEVVVHLAAAVGVRLIVEQPLRTLETNVLGTRQVLRAAARHRRKVVLASSSEVYGSSTPVPFVEDAEVDLEPPIHPRWGYGASKLLGERLALAAHRESGLAVVVARLFNCVGPGQSGRYGMVLPRFAAQALAGEELTVYGDGRQRRCFCDVRDVVRALRGLALHPGAVGEVVNVGGDEEISIADLARRVIRRSGSPSRTVLVPYREVYGKGFRDARRRVPGLRKVRSLLGWAPRIPLDETIDAVCGASVEEGRREAEATAVASG